jgi:hypothetical protein
VAVVSLPVFEKVMFFEMGEEFPEVGFDRLSGYAELAADFVHDLFFGATLLQKFEHSRADQVQPEHLPLADIENDSSVLVVRGANVRRQFQNGELLASGFEKNLDRGERARNKEGKLLTRENVLELTLRCGRPAVSA